MDNLVLEVGLALGLIALAVSVANRLGISNVPFLILIGFFVFTGAAAEGRQVQMRAVLSRRRVGDLMTAGDASIDAGEPLDAAAQRLVAGRRLALPVLDGARVLGVLSMRDVRRVPPDRRAATSAGSAARIEPPLEADDDGWTALRRMAAANLPELPVVVGGALVGAISREDLARALELEVLQPRGRIGPPLHD